MADPVFATSFYFELPDGTYVFPVKIRDRDSGEFAFHALAPDSNRTADALKTSDERELQRLVCVEGRRCRCMDREGGRKNAYNGGRDARLVIVRNLLQNAR